MTKCIFCGKGTLKRKTIRENLRYKGRSLKVNQTGEFCDFCAEGVLNSGDLKSTRKIRHDWQAHIDGFLTTQEVKRIRKKLGLTQHEAALYFGGGPNAFSRYELGEALQMRSTDNLLRLLDRHPKLMNELVRDKAA